MENKYKSYQFSFCSPLAACGLCALTLALSGCASEESFSESERIEAAFQTALKGSVSPLQWWKTAVTLKVSVKTDAPVQIWAMSERWDGTLSDYATYVTRYDNNPNNLINDYYVGQRIGDIWGFVVDGLFESDEEAKKYNAEVCDIESYITGRMTGGVLAGDLRYVDLPTTPVYQKDADGNYVLDENGQKIVIGHECDGKLSLGAGTLDDPGDRKILGNSLARLQYGLTFSFDWLGFDVSAFFQGTGNHYWYPAGMNYAFWGPYSYSYVSFIPRDFYTKMCWSEEHPDAYFPRPRAYSSTGGELSKVNSRYLQNLRYLRFKNLTVGYTIPQSLTKKIRVDHIRVYFSGENLCYWSPLKKVTKYLDPESAYTRYSTSANARDHYAYPWQKTYMFGIDITF